MANNEPHAGTNEQLAMLLAALNASASNQQQMPGAGNFVSPFGANNLTAYGGAQASFLTRTPLQAQPQQQQQYQQNAQQSNQSAASIISALGNLLKGQQPVPPTPNTYQQYPVQPQFPERPQPPAAPSLLGMWQAQSAQNQYQTPAAPRDYQVPGANSNRANLTDQSGWKPTESSRLNTSDGYDPSDPNPSERDSEDANGSTNSPPPLPKPAAKGGGISSDDFRKLAELSEEGRVYELVSELEGNQRQKEDELLAKRAAIIEKHDSDLLAQEITGSLSPSQARQSRQQLVEELKIFDKMVLKEMDFVRRNQQMVLQEAGIPLFCASDDPALIERQQKLLALLATMMPST
ncbi:hypothetical protein BDZ88DRAFT_456170 [Geranomyces variabilis]|nr:hypothetical protein BDZ88DRAFT_456170 [Geranomyces variabilis]KAJ3135731.1 hypothetical protein HDU90_003807 [Geranomyces variabilis]